MYKIVKGFIANYACLSVICFILMLGLDQQVVAGEELSSKKNQNLMISPNKHYADNLYKLILAQMAEYQNKYPFALKTYLNLITKVTNSSIWARSIDIAIAIDRKPIAQKVFNKWKKQGYSKALFKISQIKLLLTQGRLKKAFSIISNLDYEQFNADQLIFFRLLLNVDDIKHLSALALLKQISSSEIKNNTRFYLATVYKFKGKKDSALKWYQKITHGKYYFHSRITTIRLFIEMKKFLLALNLISTLPVSNEYQKYTKALLKARVQLALNEPYKVIKIAQNWLAINKDFTQFIYLRGLAYAEVGKLKAAKADLRSLLKQEPNNANILNALGYTLLMHSKHYHKASALLKKAHKLKPDSAIIMDSLGWFYYKTKQNE
jgi:predicted Zn-dependent protease